MMLPKYVVCDVETTGVEDDDWPIEIGCLFLDSNFVILETYQSLIYLPNKILEKVTARSEKDKASYWKRLEASTVHKISTIEYINNSVAAKTVVQDLIDMCKGQSPTVISDCANFEYRMMKKLFVETNQDWPFHYCVWDTSLLFEVVGIKDPKNEHRAFRDATILYRKLLEAVYHFSGTRT